MLNRRHGLLTLLCCGAALTVGLLAKSGPPAVRLMSKTYYLASFHAGDQPSWQFYVEGENADNWTTMFNIVDRPDAKSGKDIDKLAEDLKAEYTAHGGTVLRAQKMQDPNGEFTYMVVGYDFKAKQTYELQFVKVAKGWHNAYVASYGVRITDPKDYGEKTRSYMHAQSGNVGKALVEVGLPNISKLPRNGS